MALSPKATMWMVRASANVVTPNSSASPIARIYFAEITSLGVLLLRRCRPASFDVHTPCASLRNRLRPTLLRESPSRAAFREVGKPGSNRVEPLCP